MDSSKVVWSEGMFLSPQHFQQQERYVENFTREFINQIAPNCYGLSLLDLDPSMPRLGKIGVRKAKGIFPDGTPFVLNEGLVIDIPKEFTNKQVYLALPLVRTGAIDVGKDSRLRHTSIEQEIFDTTREHSDSLLVELAELNIVLKLEGEELQDYTLLPIVQIIERRAEGALLLNQAFVPHCLHFGVSNYLRDNIADIFSHMQYRARTIYTRLQADVGSKSHQALLRDYLWLQTLGRWLPKIKHWNEDGSVLTKELYIECVSMAGQMQGLEGKMPKEFLSWNQTELFSIFSVVFGELLMLLREVQLDNVTTLNWDTKLFAKRRLLRTMVQDRSLYNQGRFVLVATSKMGTTKLSEEFPKAAKLAGNSEIALLTRNGLSGVPLRNLPYAPSELKAKYDAAYFEVDTQSELWQALITKEEPIALHIDERIEDIVVEFFVII